MIKMPWRPVMAALVCAAISAGAQAQPYPQKAITIVAPFAPGGSADGIARLVARELSKGLGQSVVVENKPGAGGATGLLAVAKSQPDGYTIGIGATGAIAIAPHLPDAPPLNPDKQLQPLAKVADIPLVLATNPQAGYEQLQGFLARARVTEIPVGNSGQYTAHHLSAELLTSMGKLKTVAVPYKGSAPAVADLIGGQISVGVVDLTSVMAHIKSGALKGLAVTSAQRSKLAPDIPTMAEAGVAGYVAPAWMGLFAPKGVPVAISDRLSKELQTVLGRADVQQQILALSAEPAYLTPAQFAEFIATESRRWSGVIAGLPKATP